MADGVITSNSTPNTQPTALRAGKGKKMPAGKGRYTIGGKGTHGCSGYPVVGGEGAVHGCHKTRSAAMRQQAAIYASENQASKAETILELVKVQEMVEELGSYFGTEDVEKSVDEEENDDVENEVEDDTVSEEVVKRDYNSEQRRNMARRGQAMPDGSFPIADRADLQNAIQSVGRAANYEAAKRHIISRARALGAMDMLPDDWDAKKSLSSIFEKNSIPIKSTRGNTMGNAKTDLGIFKIG